MIVENRQAFLESMSAELDAQADRVRQLIGARHWLTDGSHKEGLLHEFLIQRVPSSIAVARGFITNTTATGRCSKEQDLLLIDTYAEAPLFQSGDIAVTTPTYVMGSISVKSSFSTNVLDDSIEGLSTISEALDPGVVRQMWLGVYFFDTTGGSCSLRHAVERTAASAELRRALEFGAELVVRATPSIIIRASMANAGLITATGYRINRLATAVFLTRLLSHIARMRKLEASIEALLVDLDEIIEETATIEVPKTGR